MKNPNISKYKGNVETAFKNGDFRQIIVFPGLSTEFIKMINSVQNKKEVKGNDKLPYDYTLLKIRSPFRIGEQQIKIFNIENIVNKNCFDEKKFKSLIINFCKNFKNSITAIPISGSLLQHYNKIESILEKNVIGAKFVIIG